MFVLYFIPFFGIKNETYKLFLNWNTYYITQELRKTNSNCCKTFTLNKCQKYQRLFFVCFIDKFVCLVLKMKLIYLF
jgi:hypothetical protein